jgi:hypothetical protein
VDTGVILSDPRPTVMDVGSAQGHAIWLQVRVI